MVKRKVKMRQKKTEMGLLKMVLIKGKWNWSEGMGKYIVAGTAKNMRHEATRIALRAHK